MEAYVVHRSVAADRDDGWTEVELFVGEVMPVEVGEEVLVLFLIEAAAEFNDGTGLPLILHQLELKS